MRTFRHILVLAIAITFASLPVLSQAQPASSNVLAEGTPVHLTVARMVSSESDQAGEVVEFQVAHDLVVGNQVLLTQNSYVYGKVIASRLNDRETGKSGYLEFRLESLALSNGQQIPLRTLRQLPTDANADLRPDDLINLVNSPYAPFAHFRNGFDVTVPKNSPLTLYVAADLTIRANAVGLTSAAASGPAVDSVASHIVNTNTTSKSLGEIAREQRERGKIGGGMVSSSQ